MNTNQPQIRPSSIDSIIKKIKDRNESYLSTILALHAFIFATKKVFEKENTEIKSSIGRRMNFANDISKKPCTPDLVIQLNENEGFIGEAKLQICDNVENRWQKYLDQILKYDNELVGWWSKNESLDHNTILLITELAYSAKLEDYIVEQTQNGSFKMNRNIALIEFDKRQRAIEYLFLRLKYGTINNKILNDRLHDSIDIPFEHLVVDTKERKFYDAPPQDIEYTMALLWQFVFPKNIHELNNPRIKFVTETKTWEIITNVDELTKYLQKTYGAEHTENREVEYPSVTHIKATLDKYVSIGLARKGEENREYVILFKNYRNPLEKIVSLTHKTRKRKVEDIQQMDLFQIVEEIN